MVPVLHVVKKREVQRIKMEEKWREILVEAALKGHKQGYCHLHSFDIEEDCALGIIHISLHSSREEAVKCSLNCDIRISHKEEFLKLGLDGKAIEIMRRNDVLREDFLTIARKTGRNES